MKQFDKVKINKLVGDLSHDDLDDVRDIAEVGDRLIEWIDEQDLRTDLWTPLLLAISRKIYWEWMDEVEDAISFESYLVRYAIEASQALES